MSFTGCSSPLSDHPKAGPTAGISIRSNEEPPNSFKAADLSSLAFSFPQTSSFNQNGLAFSINNQTYPEDLNIKFSLEPFQNNIFFPKDTAGNGQYSKPFMYGIGNNYGDISKNSSRKPSTNLNFTMESGPSRRECEPRPSTSNNFFIRNGDNNPFTNLSFPSSDSMDISEMSSSSSFPGLLAPKLSRGDSNLENQPKNKPSTNLTSCSSLVNSVSSNNGQSFVHDDSLMAPTQRKRPSTNLCGLTSLA